MRKNLEISNSLIFNIFPIDLHFFNRARNLGCKVLNIRKIMNVRNSIFLRIIFILSWA